ncbi:potassium channel family protein [Pseudoruegeria sp. SHC-113]|uniref:potassium channel family protein n=1 Tax=Pseudoruegeria sp. SHC-113 TaxID=2855439 RepID=UPI0021BA9A1F|nr:potassium channel family protein [Pseudoruegeria sp. SHC-113]MCT8161286.1 potassium channel family protein [Pseudoruegeria sp. SHC-113]
MGGNMASLREVLRAIGAALRDGRVRSVLAMTAAIVVWASIVYHFVEGWSWLDSIYFSVVAVSTVGFGDFSPETAFGKIFTIGYLVIGLGVFVAMVSTIADAILTQYKQDRDDPKGQNAKR